MPRRITATNRATGEKVSFDWDHPEPPTRSDIEMISDQRRATKIEAYKKMEQNDANVPLIDRILTSGPGKFALNTIEKLGFNQPWHPMEGLENIGRGMSQVIQGENAPTYKEGLARGQKPVQYPRVAGAVQAVKGAMGVGGAPLTAAGYAAAPIPTAAAMLIGGGTTEAANALLPQDMAPEVREALATGAGLVAGGAAVHDVPAGPNPAAWAARKFAQRGGMGGPQTGPMPGPTMAGEAGPQSYTGGRGRMAPPPEAPLELPPPMRQLPAPMGPPEAMGPHPMEPTMAEPMAPEARQLQLPQGPEPLALPEPGPPPIEMPPAGTFSGQQAVSGMGALADRLLARTQQGQQQANVSRLSALADRLGQGMGEPTRAPESPAEPPAPEPGTSLIKPAEAPSEVSSVQPTLETEPVSSPVEQTPAVIPQALPPQVAPPPQIAPPQDIAPVTPIRPPLRPPAPPPPPPPPPAPIPPPAPPAAVAPPLPAPPVEAPPPVAPVAPPPEAGLSIAQRAMQRAAAPPVAPVQAPVQAPIPPAPAPPPPAPIAPQEAVPPAPGPVTSIAQRAMEAAGVRPGPVRPPGFAAPEPPAPAPKLETISTGSKDPKLQGALKKFIKANPEWTPEQAGAHLATVMPKVHKAWGEYSEGAFTDYAKGIKNILEAKRAQETEIKDTEPLPEPTPPEESELAPPEQAKVKATNDVLDFMKRRQNVTPDQIMRQFGIPKTDLMPILRDLMGRKLIDAKTGKYNYVKAPGEKITPVEPGPVEPVAPSRASEPGPVASVSEAAAPTEAPEVKAPGKISTDMINNPSYSRALSKSQKDFTHASNEQIAEGMHSILGDEEGTLADFQDFVDRVMEKRASEEAAANQRFKELTAKSKEAPAEKPVEKPAETPKDLSPREKKAAELKDKWLNEEDKVMAQGVKADYESELKNIQIEKTGTKPQKEILTQLDNVDKRIDALIAKDTDGTITDAETKELGQQYRERNKLIDRRDRSLIPDEEKYGTREASSRSLHAEGKLAGLGHPELSARAKKDFKVMEGPRKGKPVESMKELTEEQIGEFEETLKQERMDKEARFQELEEKELDGSATPKEKAELKKLCEDMGGGK